MVTSGRLCAMFQVIIILGLLAIMKPTPKLYKHKRYLETKKKHDRGVQNTYTYRSKLMLFKYFAKFRFRLTQNLTRKLPEGKLV
jgi:hypothetical protein